MNILITENADYSSEAIKLYESLGKLLPSISTNRPIELAIREADILVVRLAYNLNANLLRQAPKLKYIVTPTTGLNHIDQKYCEDHSIEIVSLKGEVEFLNTITPTAELTWGLLLALVRKMPAALSSVLDGKWDRNLFLGSELKDKTIGVVGFGRLGKMIGRYAEAFSMKVVYHDVDIIDNDIEAEYLSLDELLKVSDVVSIHLPLDGSTKGLFNIDKMSLMKPGSLLINTSRGEILDEFALLDLLRSGHIGGAALDVLDDEVSYTPDWLRGNPLLQYSRKNSNLLITPHIGGACPDSMRRTELFCAEKLINESISGV